MIIFTLFLVALTFQIKGYSAELNTSLLYGIVMNYNKEGIAGATNTEFHDSNVIGISLMLTFEKGRGCRITC